jgi:hypothetical protein
MTAQSWPTSLALGLLFTASLCAQSSVPADSPHYYEGLPYNFIATAPVTPEGKTTFYYNDFNRYDVTYTPGPFMGQVTTRYFGSAGGTGGATDYNGAALIGNERATIITDAGAPTNVRRTPGAISGSGMTLRRTTGFTSLSLNPYDPIVTDQPISGDDFPVGSTDHRVNTRDNTIVFSGDPGNAEDSALGFSANAHFAISTAGYENIQLSFDIGVGINASANYRLLVGYYNGQLDEVGRQVISWTYTQDFYGVSSGWGEQVTLDFSDNSEFDNNASFVFQMFSIRGESGLWESVNGATSDLETGGGVANLNLGFDRITLSGDALAAIPEPATAAVLLGLVAGAVAFRRRRAG